MTERQATTWNVASPLLGHYGNADAIVVTLINKTANEPVGRRIGHIGKCSQLAPRIAGAEAGKIQNENRQDNSPCPAGVRDCPEYAHQKRVIFRAYLAGYLMLLTIKKAAIHLPAPLIARIQRMRQQLSQYRRQRRALLMTKRRKSGGRRFSHDLLAFCEHLFPARRKPMTIRVQVPAGTR